MPAQTSRSCWMHFVLQERLYDLALPSGRVLPSQLGTPKGWVMEHNPYVNVSAIDLAIWGGGQYHIGSLHRGALTSSNCTREVQVEIEHAHLSFNPIKQICLWFYNFCTLCLNNCLANIVYHIFSTILTVTYNWPGGSTGVPVCYLYINLFSLLWWKWTYAFVTALYFYYVLIIFVTYCPPIVSFCSSLPFHPLRVVIWWKFWLATDGIQFMRTNFCTVTAQWLNRS